MPWQDHLFSPFVLECPCVITGARRPSPARRRRILPLRPALGSHPSALTRLPALTQRQNRPAGTFWTRAAFLHHTRAATAGQIGHLIGGGRLVIAHTHGKQ